MSSSPRLTALVLFTATCLCLLAVREYALQPDGNLHIHFLDVGQGDATLLVSPSGKQVLIDGGPDLRTLEYLGEYLPFFDRTIELMVLTHPNLDHMAALPEVLKRYSVDAVLLAGSDYPMGKYDQLLHEVQSQNVAVLLADPEQDIDLGDGTVLDVIWPSAEGVQQDDPNDASVVLRVLFGDHAILLPGDIEALAENAILASGADVRATVLKAPHHGSISSSTPAFVEAVNPVVAVASAGRNNNFDHPHPTVVERYHERGAVFKNTADDGTVSMLFEPSGSWKFSE